MTAAEIARGLGLKRAGHNWRGPCPLHGGSSFTVSEKEGKPVFYCWSGCDRSAILAELKARGLWPESNLTPVQKQDFAKQRARDAADLHDARLFADAAAIITDGLLADLDAWDPDRAPLTALAGALRTETGMLATFRDWRAARPETARALVEAGRRHAERLQVMVSHFVIHEVARAS
jgi:hypothetical protein